MPVAFPASTLCQSLSNLWMILLPIPAYHTALLSKELTGNRRLITGETAHWSRGAAKSLSPARLPEPGDKTQPLSCETGEPNGLKEKHPELTVG